MCGFVGFTNCIDNSNIVLDNMMNKIIHRGPDSGGTYIDEGIALGFRRLSIIDLAQGDQPILNEDGSKILLFNGEIYNFQSIREKLIAEGHTFKTKSDSHLLSGTKILRSFLVQETFSVSNRFIILSQEKAFYSVQKLKAFFPTLILKRK